MADDPRIDLAAVRRDIVRANDPAVQGEGRRVVEGRVRYAAAALLAEVERLQAPDPLRYLLADEDRAVEFAAKARYEAWRATWLADGGSRLLTPPWEDIAEVMQQHWRVETDHACSAVLAALREVAGL